MKSLRVQNLCYGINAPLTPPLSFTLEEGGSLRISGANGIGKSLLLRTIMGIMPPLQGTISNPFSTAYLPQLQSRAIHLPFSLQEVINAEKKDILALGFLEEKHLHLPWNHASGGERQRTLLTKVFLSGAELLVLDEPMNHLDLRIQEKVKHLLREKLGATALLFVAHEAPGQNSIPSGRTIDLDQMAGR